MTPFSNSLFRKLQSSVRRTGRKILITIDIGNRSIECRSDIDWFARIRLYMGERENGRHHLLLYIYIHRLPPFHFLLFYQYKKSMMPRLTGNPSR